MADLYSSAINDQTEWFEKNMERVAKKMRNSLNSLLNQFDRKGGNLEYTTNNIVSILDLMDCRVKTGSCSVANASIDAFQSLI